MSDFRVGLSGTFQKPDGSPAYPDFDLAPLRQPGIVVTRLRNGATLRQADVADLDALILLGEGFGRDSIHSNGRLTLVARFGVGFDTVDVQACAENAIAVTITPDGVQHPVAVSVMAFLLALAGRMFEKDRLTREGPGGFARKSAFMGTGLVGRTLGLVGLGNIGAETARLAQAFGLKVVAYDPGVSAEAAARLGVVLVPLDDIFATADFVSLHCPLGEATRHLADANRLALMKPSAFLINTSRGPVVDQAALTQVLRERRIAGAGLDVFDPEPPDANDPLLKLDNVILAPHALCHTDQCFAGIGASCVASTLAVMRGEVPEHLVDRTIGENAAFRAKLAAFAARRT